MDEESTTPDVSPTRPVTSDSLEDYANGLIGSTTSRTAQCQSRTSDPGSSSTKKSSRVGMYLDTPNASQVNITSIIHRPSETRTSNRTALLSPVHHHQNGNVLDGYTADFGDGVLSHTPPGSPHRVSTSWPHYGSRTTDDMSTGNQKTSAWVPSASCNQSFGFQSSRSSSRGSTQSEIDRTFVPSQLGTCPSGVFTPDAKHIPSRHGSGARIVRISPTKRYSSAAKGLETVPARFTSMEQRVSMPAPLVSDYKTSLGRSSVDSKAVESSSTPNFNVSRVHGHRRNKTTMSDVSVVITPPGSKRLAPQNFEFDSSTVASAADLTKKLLVDHASASSPFRYEYAQQATADNKSSKVSSLAITQKQLKSQDVPHVITTTNLMRLSPLHEHSIASGPSSEEDLTSCSKVHHARTESGHSTTSASTVASDSWNPIDDFAAFHGDEPESTKNATDLQLAYQQDFGLGFEQLTWEEAREIYPSDQYVTGMAEHSVDVRDFAYMAKYPINTSTAAKHVRFASKSDQAPSVNHKSNSDSSGGSKELNVSIIDLYDCRLEEEISDRGQQAGETYRNERRNDCISSAAELPPPTPPSVDRFRISATDYQPATPTMLRIVDENETDYIDDVSDADIFFHTALASPSPAEYLATNSEQTDSPKSNKYEYVPPIKINKLRKRNPPPPQQQHRRNSSLPQHQRTSSASVFRRISSHFSSFVDARQGLEPVNSSNVAPSPTMSVSQRDSGVLDRSYQFPAPARVPEQQRIVSEHLLTTSTNETSIGHKRSKSVGRLLG
jgi:hypothetical protein